MPEQASGPGETNGGMVYHHDFHPPDEVRVFSVPASRLRRWDTTAVVYEVRLNNLALRHYAFANHWFSVNCTLDLDGRFVTESGPLDYCFNCDITTPLFCVGNDLYSVDLDLDVLVAPDGRQHLVQDEDDFSYSVEHGCLTEEEQAGARRGLGELLSIITGSGLVPFLEQILPFGVIAERISAAAMITRPLADFPMLHAARRGRYFGQMLDAV